MSPDFGTRFAESEGEPIKYKGEWIHMLDCVPVRSPQIVRVEFISVDSDWRQGIHLSTEGRFEIKGSFYKKAIALWEDTAPSPLDLTVHSHSGTVDVKNVWDRGNGTMESWYNGGAMKISERGDRRTYHCNDGAPDDDFDDLVFTLRLLPD